MLLNTTGALSVIGDCLDDQQQGSVRRLVALAASSDGSSDYAAIFIHVTDVIDHPIRFSADRKEAMIAEGAPRGTVVTTLPPVFYRGLITPDQRSLALS